MKRRDLLQAGGLIALGALTRPLSSSARGESGELHPVPRVNGGINVQPLRRFDSDPSATLPLIRPDLVDLQLQQVYELGFEWMRITISYNAFGPDFLAAIPYVRAARALGIHVLGVITQFTGFDLLQALSRPDTREEVLDVYLTVFDDTVVPASPLIPEAGRFAAQVLNEPTHFLGIPPDVYVRDFLAPAMVHLKEDDPTLTVVAAAAVGSVDGLLRTRAMLEAGLEHFCDRVAYHIYSRDLVRHYAGLATLPAWITESGVAGPSRHLSWMTDTFDDVRRRIADVEIIFYFDLFDFEPNRFRLIEIVPAAEDGFQVRDESPAALRYLEERVVLASGDLPRARYRDLIPDITRYFPTEEDLRLVASTSVGRRTWRF